MAYPAVLGEFVDTLNWLRITHEERSLLEEIMHLEMPTESTSQHLLIEVEATTIPQPISRQMERRSYSNVSKRHGQSKSISMNGARSHGRDRLHVKHRRRTMAMTQKEALDDSCLESKATTSSLDKEGLQAFAIPWQTSDSPLWAEDMDIDTSSGSEGREEVVEGSSPSESDFSTPCETNTENIEYSHDYVKIPWSVDTE